MFALLNANPPRARPAPVPASFLPAWARANGGAVADRLLDVAVAVERVAVVLHRFMAERAESRRTVELEGGSHSVGIPEAAQVVDMVREAATEGAREASAA